MDYSIIDIFLYFAEIIVTIFGIYVAKEQLSALTEQTKKEHEATRRRTTVDVLNEWCKATQQATNLAEKAARDLSTAQCTKLYNNEPCEVTSDIKPNICKLCENYSNCCKTNESDNQFDCRLKKKNRVDGKILSDLRWHVVTYLNALETVMTAWHMGIVDKNVIEEQFSFLLYPGKGRALANFRDAAKGYPYIEEFLDEIKDKSQTDPKKPL